MVNPKNGAVVDLCYIMPVLRQYNIQTSVVASSTALLNPKESGSGYSDTTKHNPNELRGDS